MIDSGLGRTQRPINGIVSDVSGRIYQRALVIVVMTTVFLYMRLPIDTQCDVKRVSFTRSETEMS